MLIPTILWVYSGKFTPKINQKEKKMTVDEMQSIIVYLTDKVEKLEKTQCKCNDDKTAVSPPNKYVTNYDEDEECLTCSA